MNLVDLVILAIVLGSIAEGVRRGGLSQLLSFGGFGLGFALGAALAPIVARKFSGGAKVLVTIFIVMGAASLVSGAGRALGRHVIGRIATRSIAPADATLGGGVSGLTTLLVVWLMAGMLAASPLAPLTAGIQRSAIVRGMNGMLPPAPSVFSQIQGLLNTAGFPPVFAELEPAPGADVALPSDPAVRAAVKAAQASTVRIEGTGCGGIQTGSGFVVASGLVVTNAHVVAGIDRPSIEDSKGQHRATTILFDPDMDLAILTARGLAGKPLNLAQQERPAGDGGAVLGYPGGGPFTAVPAAIVDRMEAVGRDIYSRNLSTRDVYRLKANVRPGNSGGPVVAPDGQVTGVVFSRSAYREEIGYALTSISVIPKVNQANQSDREVDTGPCAA